ncbi:hypothetical protein CLOHYLEM_05073 [[Clostridium] hylemonae DSM 15053]|uniref:SdpI/YhfL protein family n=2 Tax=[Clostridium] hylemonae TaxID=89153 RepID=C0BZ34_9FIRM|nr:hypothetical protein CLOHYLEM_05073 [[Clostridium] hylemonae DSM 15053]
MIVLGKRWEKKPPADRNGLSGYRSTMSRLNQDTWSYAHKLWGKINFTTGIALAVLSFAFIVYIKDWSDFETWIVYLVFIQIAIMALTIIPTEIKLNKTFTKKGGRKQNG